MLNPQKNPLCLERAKYSSVVLPLQINQTLPTSIELIRFDLQTSQNETSKLSSSQISKMVKKAQSSHDPNAYGALTLKYEVSKPGLYRLGRVVDETNMEVAHPVSEALIVSCPLAKMQSFGPTRCRGDLSNVGIEVEGSPPLKIKYRKTVNGEDRDISYQSIQPDDFTAPLSASNSGSLVSTTSPDLSWAASHKVIVPLNETLARQGLWSYSIDEVSDAHGNVVSYSRDDSEYETVKPKAAHLEDEFMVYDRPIASLGNHKSRTPVRKAKGERVALPIRVTEGGKPAADRDFGVTYKFTPIDSIKDSGDHADDAKVIVADIRSAKQTAVDKPGLYSLVGVDSEYCAGDVEEPTSFLLVNPPEPSIQVSAQPISDKCAGRPVGMHVDLDMEGSPEFKVFYTSQRRGDRNVKTEWATFQGPRGQLEFRPAESGHWTYKIVQLEDSVYKGVDLRGQTGLLLEQEVRPSAFASFVQRQPSVSSCIEQPVEFAVQFFGEGPWTLEYEIVHGRSRDRHTIQSDKDFHTIRTPHLNKGGEYSLVLVGVTDREGCREALQEHAKINVRHQRPKVSFGFLEGKRSIRTLESREAELPVRMTGEGPWTLEVQHSLVDASGEKREAAKKVVRVLNPNDVVVVAEPGVYEITSVRDRLCPGIVDTQGSSFEVSLVSRPKPVVPDSPLMEKVGDKYVRKDVCEGDEDNFDLMFSGRPPFEIGYQERFYPAQGSKSIKNSGMNVPLNSAKIKFETGQAGKYEYAFTEISDYNYDHEPSKQKPLLIEQKVHSRPAAVFDDAGTVHSFCQSRFQSSDAELIPISLRGQAPFTVDIEVRHATASKAAKPQTLTIPNLMSNTEMLSVPHRLLQAGSSTLYIQRIRDARGCERMYDSAAFLTSSSNTQRQAAMANAPPRMQIAVHDAPHLTPLEPEKEHHCVGDRLAFALSGTAPFYLHYNFQGKSRTATVKETTFRRTAETPGNFSITSIKDSASACRATVRDVGRIIHDLPRVSVSKGKSVRYDIHAGGSVDVLFEFQGEPPFTFTYERREAPRVRPGSGSGRGGSHGAGEEVGRPGRVLGTKTLTSDSRKMTVAETQEGSYEVVAVSDRWCRYARPGYESAIGLRPGGVADRAAIAAATDAMEDDDGLLLED